MNIKQISFLLSLSFLLFWGCNQQTNGGTTDSTDTTATTPEVTEAPTNKKRENVKILKNKTVFSHASEADPGKKMTYVEYNEDGHVVKSIDYDFIGNGKVVEEDTYEYNAAGQKIKSVEKSGGITSTTLYTYNDAGHTVGEEWTTNQGEKGSFTAEYNTQGKPVKITYLDEEGNLDKIIQYVYEFNEQGKVTLQKRMELDAEGNETLDYHVTKEHNERGLLAKENVHDHQTGEVITSETFAYDERGNEIENHEYDHEGNLLQRFVSEYNEYGELVKDEAFDSEGTRDFWTEYTYDENGTEVSRTANDQYGDKTGERVTAVYW